MRAAKRFFPELLRRVDNLLDDLKFHLKALTGSGKRISATVIPYRGYGRSDLVHIQGRVLKFKPLYGTNHNSPWKSFIDSYRRFGTEEIRDALLDVIIDGRRFEVKTDDEGFFRLNQPLVPPVVSSERQTWLQVILHLRKTPWQEVDLKKGSEALIPDTRAKFGVISDIDDTILQTHVTSILKLKTLYYTIFKNAAGREPFKEVASFYQALHRDTDRDALNPFFYVSNSPWNLYDLIQEFLSLNHLPKGPILLRDVGIPRDRPREGQRGHKYTTIENILNTYPGLPFLLIGDSGEKDADIYLEIARRFPDRIKGIYIRDVRSHKRARRIAWLIREATNVPIQLIHQYRDAAADAAAKGLLKLEQFEKWEKSLNDQNFQS